MQEAKFIWDEMAKYFKLAGLDSLVHFVTYKCNARCEHCFFSDELNKKGELSKDEIFRVINSIGPLKGVLISGGEPFLRKDLAEIIIEYEVKCSPGVVSIPTNGFNTEKVLAGCEAILHSCKGLNLTIAVSLDGLFDAHDKARHYPGGFTKAVETACSLVRLKEKYPRLRLHIVTVMIPANIDSLQAISKFVREEIDPDYHWFEPVRQSDPGDILTRVSHDSLRTFLKKNIIYYFKKVKGTSGNIYSSMLLNNAITTFSLNSLNIALDNFLEAKQWPVRCVAGRKIAVMYPNGDVSACELRLPVANVRDYDYNLTKLLKEEVFRNEIKAVSKGKCSCSHGCFIPPSVRFNPFYMGFLAIKTMFARYQSEPKH